MESLNYVDLCFQSERLMLLNQVGRVCLAGFVYMCVWMKLILLFEVNQLLLFLCLVLLFSQCQMLCALLMLNPCNVLKLSLFEEG